MKRILFLALMICGLASCGAPYSRPTYNNPSIATKTRQHEAIEPIGQSLFSDKTATISEENIQKLFGN